MKIELNTSKVVEPSHRGVDPTESKRGPAVEINKQIEDDRLVTEYET